MKPIFVGREQEQREFRQWLISEPTEAGGRRAALLIGPAGMGKSALLLRFEDLCINHKPERWYVQRVSLNANETPSAFLERLLLDTHRLFAGKLLRKGPHDRHLLKELLKAIPTLGNILAALVDEDKRPGWQRFLDYAAVLSEMLAGSRDCFVLLVDPDMAMQSGQADEWLTIAADLPERVHVVIAQRPDDVIAAHTEARRRFGLIPTTGSLPDLDEDSVRQWYEAEIIKGGRLIEAAKHWGTDAVRRLPAAAYKRYRGHPVAHDAIVRLLAVDEVDDPVAAVAQWPRAVAELMDMLFASLTRQGEERLRAALVLQVFSVPTPREAWAQAASLSVEALTAALADARYGHFFTPGHGGVYMPFHDLFAQRLERELESMPQRTQELAEAAWQAIEPVLDRECLATSIPGEFELMAATRVASRF
ncbi:MAG: ATP-binding protein, partial [Planctomycetota bacterium]